MTGVPGSGTAALASLERVLDSGVACEVWTTVHPAPTPPAALERLAGKLAARGIERWILQPFRPQGCDDADLIAAAQGRTILDRELMTRLASRVPGVTIRA